MRKRDVMNASGENCSCILENPTGICNSMGNGSIACPARGSALCDSFCCLFSLHPFIRDQKKWCVCCCQPDFEREAWGQEPGSEQRVAAWFPGGLSCFSLFLVYGASFSSNSFLVCFFFPWGIASVFRMVLQLITQLPSCPLYLLQKDV